MKKGIFIILFALLNIVNINGQTTVYMTDAAVYDYYSKTGITLSKKVPVAGKGIVDIILEAFEYFYTGTVEIKIEDPEGMYYISIEDQTYAFTDGKITMDLPTEKITYFIKGSCDDWKGPFLVGPDFWEKQYKTHKSSTFSCD